MNILVTGGAGFIGSHVVDLLVENNCSVFVIDNLSHGNKENINPKAIFYETDINSIKVKDIFKHNRIDAVMHLAAQINARISLKKPIFDAETNILGSLNLLECSIKYNVKKFIFASSAAVYGEPEYLPYDELHPINPINSYGVSKHAVEHYLYLYHKLYGMDYAALRYSNVYGPRQNPEGEAGVISIFINNMLNNQPLVIYGDGSQTRDFIFVEDVAKATFLALSTKTKRKIMNISMNKETSINQILEILKIFSNNEIKVIYAKPQPGDPMHIRLDNSAAKKELFWMPSVTIEEGLEKTMDYYKQLSQTILSI